jgi:23S rRNA (cytidine1920-2'-O)/16S rRNA (cytidine1409-2'-O)-methyltransferase
MPAVADCTRPGGALVALVKPQFEVGRKEASRTRGVVRDDAVRSTAVANVARSVREAGFEIRMQRDSVLAGPKGNREVFLYATRL